MLPLQDLKEEVGQASLNKFIGKAYLFGFVLVRSVGGGRKRTPGLANNKITVLHVLGILINWDHLILLARILLIFVR